MDVKVKALMEYMSELSEEAYAAGWIANLEYALWNAIINGSKTFGRLEFTPEIITRLKQLSEECSGWIYFDDLTEETWIPLEKWQEMFTQYTHKVNSDDVRAKVREWAYDDTPPSQDHDLMLISLNVNDLLLELAADDSCPKQQDFLSCLYLLVGDAVMTKGEGTSFDDVETLLTLAEEETNLLIKTWIQRSRHLLSHPDEFDYDLWCSGGLAAKS